MPTEHSLIVACAFGLPFAIWAWLKLRNRHRHHHLLLALRVLDHVRRERLLARFTPEFQVELTNALQELDRAVNAHREIRVKDFQRRAAISAMTPWINIVRKAGLTFPCMNSPMKPRSLVRANADMLVPHRRRCRASWSA